VESPVHTQAVKKKECLFAVRRGMPVGIGEERRLRWLIKFQADVKVLFVAVACAAGIGPHLLVRSLM
jgi:hypothetical protein